MSFPQKPKKLRAVYLDHAAATPLDRQVLLALQPFLTKEFANPSGLSTASIRVRQAVDDARASIADILRTQPDTIVFTSGGTESCNLGILGVAKSYALSAKRSGHIVTTQIEHHAVLGPVKKLEEDGWKVTRLPVDRSGRVNAEHVRSALRKDTALVSIMYANNEMGTVQPIAEIGREILRWRKERETPYPYFHTDACQAAGFLELHVDRLHIDLLSVNGSKMYGPKGVGFLYKRRSVSLEPLMYGGGQEAGLRSGTEHVSGIVGIAKALTIANQRSRITNHELKKLRDNFWGEIQKKIPDVAINGSKEERLPNNLSVTFRGVEAEALVLYLNAYGIVVASGAACASITDETSHVLRACGVSEEDARSTVRFTLGRETKKEDIAYVMRYLPDVVKELRLLKQYGNIKN